MNTPTGNLTCEAMAFLGLVNDAAATSRTLPTLKVTLHAALAAVVLDAVRSSVAAIRATCRQGHRTSSCPTFES